MGNNNKSFYFNQTGAGSMIVIPFICGMMIDLVSEYLGTNFAVFESISRRFCLMAKL